MRKGRSAQLSTQLDRNPVIRLQTPPNLKPQCQLASTNPRFTHAHIQDAPAIVTHLAASPSISDGASSIQRTSTPSLRPSPSLSRRIHRAQNNHHLQQDPQAQLQDPPAERHRPSSHTHHSSLILVGQVQPYGNIHISEVTLVTKMDSRYRQTRHPHPPKLMKIPYSRSTTPRSFSSPSFSIRRFRCQPATSTTS